MGQAKRFWLHLAEGLDAKGLDQMGDMALTLGQPNLAVLVGKQAAERSVILPRAYYPVADIVPDGLAVSRAFAMAIARRESEFDPAARSTADARGLMQLLPGTAAQMARELQLPFEAARLTTDPAYNAKLGSAYLAHLMKQFGPSVALVAAGYNAGPSRPRQWIEEYGDPRLPSVDVVDWVESIPFTETRTYVMRVVEGVVIYRAKLRGSVGPVNVTAELKG
jgi:soluble lytic murein transglycosylase